MDEKRRAYNRDYYKRNRERILQYRKKWTAENKDKVMATNLRYYQRKLEQEK